MGAANVRKAAQAERETAHLLCNLTAPLSLVELRLQPDQDVMRVIGHLFWFSGTFGDA